MRLLGMLLGLLVLCVLLGVISSSHAANKGAGATPTPSATNTSGTATPTVMASPSAPSPSPTCCFDLSATGSTACVSPDVYSYTFDIFNSCFNDISGGLAFSFEASETQSGPWYTLDQTSLSGTTLPANSHVVHTDYFTETGFLRPYEYYRVGLYFDYMTCGSYGFLVKLTDPVPLCIGARCTTQFQDVPQGSTFYPYVHCLACIGIVSGYPDGTFRPNNNVTRGQLAKIVSNAAGFSEPHTNQAFQDVPTSDVFYLYIARLADRSIISGYQCGGPSEPCVSPSNLPYFRTTNNATRGQMARILCLAQSCTTEPHTEQTFQDVPVGSAFYHGIEYFASRGILNGYPCGGPGEPCIPPENRPYFRPNNNATRGQTSKIVANIYFSGCDPPAR